MGIFNKRLAAVIVDSIAYTKFKSINKFKKNLILFNTKRRSDTKGTRAEKLQNRNKSLVCINLYTGLNQNFLLGLKNPTGSGVNSRPEPCLTVHACSSWKSQLLSV